MNAVYKNGERVFQASTFTTQRKALPETKKKKVNTLT